MHGDRRPPAGPRSGQRVALLYLSFQTSPALLRHRIIMHIALHPDVTDSTVSQTAACGEIIIYSENYCEENTV